MRTGRGRTLRRSAAGGTLALVALLTLSGCGGAAGLGAESAAALHEQVAAVRVAATSDDRAAADAAVTAFRAEVRRLAATGELSPAGAASLLEHADAIASGVDAEVPATPTPTPTPTQPPAPTAAGPPPERAAAEPAPTVSPAELRAAQRAMAQRITALLRERIQERIREQEDQRKAEAKKSANNSGEHRGDGGHR